MSHNRKKAEVAYWDFSDNASYRNSTPTYNYYFSSAQAERSPLRKPDLAWSLTAFFFFLPFFSCIWKRGLFRDLGQALTDRKEGPIRGGKTEEREGRAFNSEQTDTPTLFFLHFLCCYCTIIILRYPTESRRTEGESSIAVLVAVFPPYRWGERAALGETEIASEWMWKRYGGTRSAG